jgi:hypothetical protein
MPAADSTATADDVVAFHGAAVFHGPHRETLSSLFETVANLTELENTGRKLRLLAAIVELSDKLDAAFVGDASDRDLAVAVVALVEAALAAKTEAVS